MQLTDDADQTGGCFVEDGVVKFIYTDTRYKDMIRFLAKLWSEDLINKGHRHQRLFTIPIYRPRQRR